MSQKKNLKEVSSEKVCVRETVDLPEFSGGAPPNTALLSSFAYPRYFGTRRRRFSGYFNLFSTYIFRVFDGYYLLFLFFFLQFYSFG